MNCQLTLANFDEICTLATKFSSARANAIVYNLCISHKMTSEISRFVEDVRKRSPLSAAYLTALTESNSRPERITDASVRKTVCPTLEKRRNYQNGVPPSGKTELGKKKNRNVQSGKLKPSLHSATAAATKAPTSRIVSDDKTSGVKVVGQLPIVQVKSKKLMALLEKASSLMNGTCENRSLHGGECCVCRLFKYKGNEKGIIRRSSYAVLLKLHSSHDSIAAKLKTTHSWLNSLEKQLETGDGRISVAMETSDSKHISKSSTSSGLARAQLPILGSSMGASDEEPGTVRPSRRQRHAKKEKDLVRLKAEADLADLELRTKKQSALAAHNDALQRSSKSEYAEQQAEKRLQELVSCKLHKRQLDKQMRGQLKRHKSGAKK